MTGRSILIPIALLASLAACDPTDPESSCINPASTPTADTVMRLSFGGRKVLFASADEITFTFHTSSQYLSMIALRHAPDGTQWVRLVVPDLAGPGDFQLRDPSDPTGVALGHYGCQKTPYYSEDFLPDSQYMLEFRPAGVAGDTLRVTSYDSVTGVIEGEFRFTGAPADGGESIMVTDGHFRATVVPYSSPVQPALVPRPR